MVFSYKVLYLQVARSKWDQSESSGGENIIHLMLDDAQITILCNFMNFPMVPMVEEYLPSTRGKQSDHHVSSNYSTPGVVLPSALLIEEEELRSFWSRREWSVCSSSTLYHCPHVSLIIQNVMTYCIEVVSMCINLGAHPLLF